MRLVLLQTFTKGLKVIKVKWCSRVCTCCLAQNLVKHKHWWNKFSFLMLPMQHLFLSFSLSQWFLKTLYIYNSVWFVISTYIFTNISLPKLFKFGCCYILQLFLLSAHGEDRLWESYNNKKKDLLMYVFAQHHTGKSLNPAARILKMLYPSLSPH